MSSILKHPAKEYLVVYYNLFTRIQLGLFTINGHSTFNVQQRRSKTENMLDVLIAIELFEPYVSASPFILIIS